jgi:predicted ATP-grasp superfamily ATP-dependent carboligase
MKGVARRPAPPDLDEAVPALTLKVGTYALHHGGLAVARTLGRAGVSVYGVHEDRFAPAGLSRYTAGRFIWSTGGQHSYQDQLLAGVQAVGERIGRPTVLIPTDDHAAIFVATHADTLRRWFLLPRQSAAMVREVTDKSALAARCCVLGVPVPAAEKVTSREQLEAFTQTTRLPVVVKCCEPWLLPTGRRATSTRIITTRRDLLGLDTSTPLLLQEHIPADRSEDWLFHGYCDEASDCLVAFTGRKVRSYPTDAGETALGRATRNPTLEGQARSLLRSLGYRGIVSLDYRFDWRDGMYKLLDLNPRVGAIFRLFETDTGVDVIRALHLDLTGKTVPSGAPIDGRVVVVEGNDLRSGWAHMRDRRLTARELWSSWQAIDEAAWLATDDVLPALVALTRAVVRRGPHSRAGNRRGDSPRYLRGRARTGRVQPKAALG